MIRASATPSPLRTRSIRIGLALLCAIPVIIAARSPLLDYRAAPYIASGLAGAVAMAVLLLQPLLAAGFLPGLHPLRARRLHRILGTALVLLVLIHIGGLYLTSPPDLIDALLLVSPTPFSVYGVIALWALLATALLALLRRRLKLRPALWGGLHNGVAGVGVISSVVHALLIEGTMGEISKWVLCLAAVAATLAATWQLRWARRRAR